MARGRPVQPIDLSKDVKTQLQSMAYSHSLPLPIRPSPSLPLQTLSGSGPTIPHFPAPLHTACPFRQTVAIRIHSHMSLFHRTSINSLVKAKDPTRKPQLALQANSCI